MDFQIAAGRPALKTPRYRLFHRRNPFSPDPLSAVIFPPGAGRPELKVSRERLFHRTNPLIGNTPAVHAASAISAAATVGVETISVVANGFDFCIANRS
jgi:hypothetical protein